MYIKDYKGCNSWPFSIEMSALFRRLFTRKNKQKQRDNITITDGGSSPSASPVRRRLLHGYRHHHRHVVSLSTTTKMCNHNLRLRRLMKEYHNVQRQSMHQSEPVFTAELIDDNLFEWSVKLYKIDTDSRLHRDMRQLKVEYIELHLVFPENYPFEPPFMRVVAPLIERGYVMEGGAICMELLTPKGWASAYTVEAVIMQFAASVVKGHGRLTKIAEPQKQQQQQQRQLRHGATSSNRYRPNFSLRLAEETFRSLVKTHEKYGWVSSKLADG